MMEVSKEVLYVVVSILAGIVGFYIKTLIGKVDSFGSVHTNVEILKTQISSLQSIKNEWDVIRVQVTKLLVELEYIKKTQEEIAILKRNQDTIWKSIDEIKDKMFDEDFKAGNS